MRGQAARGFSWRLTFITATLTRRAAPGRLFPSSLASCQMRCTASTDEKEGEGEGGENTTHSGCHRRRMSVSHLVTAALVSHRLAAAFPASSELRAPTQRCDCIPPLRPETHSSRTAGCKLDENNNVFLCEKHRGLWSVHQRWQQSKCRAEAVSVSLPFPAAAKWPRLHRQFQV